MSEIALRRDVLKKHEELTDLTPFLVAYRSVTGLDLRDPVGWERPDFVAQRSDGLEVGIELTKVMMDPESRFWKGVMRGEEYGDSFDTTIRLQGSLYGKGEKRRSAGWDLPDRTILVLQLIDCPLAGVGECLDELLEEMDGTGFLEIWAADYTLVDAYGAVQLYCIKPLRWQGLHDHPGMWGKPYG